MKFESKTEEEIVKLGLCPEGDYDFLVLKCEDKTSKNGNDMFHLKNKIFGPDGKEFFADDYISPHFMEHKFRHFCVTIGLRAEYEKGELTAEQCVDRGGKCSVFIDEDPSGEFKPKNAVRDYLYDIALGATEDEDGDDEIPL